jgi:hypothetical protein
LLPLAGCPAGPRYLVAEVASPSAAVADALVAADCGDHTRSAGRTDDRGRAPVPLYGKFAAESCVVTVAKPGYRTIERRGAEVCSTAAGCPVARYRIVPR